MAKIESEYKFGKVKNGFPYYGKVRLSIELTKTGTLEIIENYAGEGFISQGSEEIIPENGYDIWKKGIRQGIVYAYNKLENNKGLKITVEDASGLATDTNSTIIGFAASRAILNKLEHCESANELQQLEELVFSSWGFDSDAFPNFEECKIEGKKIVHLREQSLFDRICSQIMKYLSSKR